jgi:[protein-PII] uridylyltransferase
VETRVKVDNRSARGSTVVDVFARDRMGLLADVTSALHRAGLTIHVARIATEGNRAVDAFYVTDPAGRKLEGAESLAALEAAVARAIEPPAA